MTPEADSPRPTSPAPAGPDSARAAIVPARYSPWFLRGFGKFVRGMFRRKFFAVRWTPDSPAAWEGLDQTNRPLIVALNHSAWWDPLVGVLLHTRLMPTREPVVPMDARELAKFGFFRRLGLFGLEPEREDAAQAMSDYVLERLAPYERGPVKRGRHTDHAGAFWITPQGSFADVRDEIRLRPGAAMVAARLHNPIVVALAIEYAFWLDQKPEAFFRCVRVAPPETQTSTAAWHRALTRAMQQNQSALAGAVMSRDPSRFAVLEGAGAARINPAMDLWLRVTGQRASLTDRAREEAQQRVKQVGAP